MSNQFEILTVKVIRGHNPEKPTLIDGTEHTFKVQRFNNGSWVGYQHCPSSLVKLFSDWYESNINDHYHSFEVIDQKFEGIM